MKTYLDRFAPSWIEAPSRYRVGLDEETVVGLTDSIRRLGLLSPPVVRVEDHGDGEQTIYLVAGRHRVEACKRLDLEFIDCLVLTGSDTEARLWEIAENLHRADLSAQERADHIAEWIKLTELQSAQIEPIESKRQDGRGHRRKGGLNEAVRELGIDRNEAQRSVKIASIPQEAREIADEAGLDTQTARLEIARAADPVAKAKELRQSVADRKLLSNAAENVVVGEALADAAQRIVDHLPDREMPALLADLDAAKLSKLASAIRNIQRTGVRVGSDMPVFDRTRAGAA